jgi:hypothetical protein
MASPTVDISTTSNPDFAALRAVDDCEISLYCSDDPRHSVIFYSLQNSGHAVDGTDYNQISNDAFLDVIGVASFSTSVG